jgi:hypothetical protein
MDYGAASANKSVRGKVIRPGGAKCYLRAAYVDGRLAGRSGRSATDEG